MIIVDKIRDEELVCNINRDVAKYLRYHQVKLINMNIIQANKYYLSIKVKL